MFLRLLLPKLSSAHRFFKTLTQIDADFASQSDCTVDVEATVFCDLVLDPSGNKASSNACLDDESDLHSSVEDGADSAENECADHDFGLERKTVQTSHIHSTGENKTTCPTLDSFVQANSTSSQRCAPS